MQEFARLKPHVKRIRRSTHVKQEHKKIDQKKSRTHAVEFREFRSDHHTEVHVLGL